MIRRRDSLSDTLQEIESGDLAGVGVVVVSRAWWDGLAPAEQAAYRRRCDRAAVVLRADERLSRHFVELGDHPLGPRLSSEEDQ